MKKTFVALVLLTAVAVAGSAQVGIGFNVSFSPASSLFGYYGFDSIPLFYGLTLRYRPSALSLESGISLLRSYGSFIYGYLDIGLSFDLWIFRFGLAGGVDVVDYSSPWMYEYTGMSSYSAVGFNGKLSFDLKLGNVTMGLSAAVPIDLLVNAPLHGEWVGVNENPLRAYAVQASLNIIYWIMPATAR